jgi:phosphate transport system permease protein
VTAIAPSPPRDDDRSGRELAPHGLQLKELAFRCLLLACLIVAVVFLVILLWSVVQKGWPRLNLDLITEQPSRRPQRAGIQSAIFGTLWVIGLAAAFCIPTGILAAIYLEEYANPNRWYNRLIELNLQNLAAVPAIVYGILGLGLIARGPLGFGFTVMTASLTLSLLVLPVVIIASREAIRAVPNSIREGSLALGATRWQTTQRQVLPAAVPGMATGSILALSRALGEAAPLVLLGGVSFITFNPDGPDSPYTVLPILIFSWTIRPQEEFRVAASAAIVVLLVILLAMNSLAIFLRNRDQHRW